MNNDLTNEKIDKIMFRYFDDKFGNSELKEEQLDSGDFWEGFFLGDELLIGHPADDDSGHWFYSGPLFIDGTGVLGIHESEFVRSMRRYLKKNNPELHIRQIS